MNDRLISGKPMYQHAAESRERSWTHQFWFFHTEELRMAQINEVDESAQRDSQSKECHSESTEVQLKCMNFATFLMLLMNQLLSAAYFDFTLTFDCRFLDVFLPRIPSGLQKRKGRGVAALLNVFDNKVSHCIYNFVSHSLPTCQSECFCEDLHQTHVTAWPQVVLRRQFALPFEASQVIKIKFENVVC